MNLDVRSAENVFDVRDKALRAVLAVLSSSPEWAATAHVACTPRTGRESF